VTSVSKQAQRTLINKCRSKQALLTDCVEAAVRTMPEPAGSVLLLTIGTGCIKALEHSSIWSETYTHQHQPLR
jgi:hypothetical protein